MTIEMADGACTFDLSAKKMRELAESKDVTNQQWALIMRKTADDRTFYNKRYTLFQGTRLLIEFSVKIAVTITLGVSLFLVSPASLILGGAAFTLALSTLIYTNINLKPLTLTVSVNDTLSDFDNKAWSAYRAKWAMNARNKELDAEQSALNTNMTRVGLALVVSFATFAAIVGGVALPIAVTSVLFSGSLFYRQIDEVSPYLETEAMPTLTYEL